MDKNKTLILQDLLRYDRIVIQCHNVPDADALASGFALVRYFQSQGHDVSFVYGGREVISKPNLVLMTKMLQIPVHHVSELEEPDLLITVDSQYGQSNIQKFPAKVICVIDHHEVDDRNRLPRLSEVMENYGSCATVLYGLLKDAGYDLKSDKTLQTALYYGLYTDTGKFQELWHPADKDMWDELRPDEGILDILKNTNIASPDLETIGAAFSSHEINEKYRYGVVRVNTGDPNILGIVSDTFLEVDSIDTCIAYAFLPNGVKLSVRSCRKETRADELAKVIVHEIGNAGGHIRKAGGFVPKDNLTTCYSDWEDFWRSLLHTRLQNYFDNTDVVRAGEMSDLTGYDLYRKLPVIVGVADLNKVFSSGEEVRVRTLEGDIDLTVSPDQYLMIGVSEEIYPIKKAAFDKNYRLTGREYEFQNEYIPGVRTCKEGKRISLGGITASCKSLGSSLVYAKRLDRRTHVFTIWDPQKYISGEEGDWIAVQKDNPEDVYIIADNIFSQTYRLEKRVGKEGEEGDWIAAQKDDLKYSNIIADSMTSQNYRFEKRAGKVINKNIFISYRRDTGSILARLVYDRITIQKRWNAFLDVEELKTGDFRRMIRDKMRSCDIFILILSKNSLDRCSNPQDNVRLEIETAREQNLSFIPVISEDFEWPQNMPEGLEYVKDYNAVPYIQVYSQSFFERLYEFIKDVRENNNAAT